MINLLPVLPEFDEDFLGHIISISRRTQAVLSKGVNPLSMSGDSLSIFGDHLLLKDAGVIKKLQLTLAAK